MTPAFDAAKYYDCVSSDVLSHESVEEALEAVIDFYCDPDCDVEGVIRAHTPITVTAWDPDVVDDDWLDYLARQLLDDAVTSFIESFGHPDDLDDEACGLGNAHVISARPAAVNMLRAFFKDAVVGTHTIVGEQTFSADEVLALMRKHRPDWFEEKERG